jgi:hypothetical protein
VELRTVPWAAGVKDEMNEYPRDIAGVPNFGVENFGRFPGRACQCYPRNDAFPALALTVRGFSA